jgi:hypothetical protein
MNKLRPSDEPAVDGDLVNATAFMAHSPSVGEVPSGRPKSGGGLLPDALEGIADLSSFPLNMPRSVTLLTAECLRVTGINSPNASRTQIDLAAAPDRGLAWLRDLVSQ